MMFPMSKAKTKIRNDLFPILDDEYEDYLDDASTCHSPPPQSHQKSQPPPLPPKKRSDPNTSLIATAATQKLPTSATLPNVSSHQQLFSPESLAPSDGGGGSERLIPILRESDGTVVVPKKQSTAPFSEGSDDLTTTSTESTRYSSLPNSTPRVF